MLKYDYELIYEVRKRHLNTSEKRNLQIQFENKARKEADEIHQKYLDFLKNKLGHNRFEVTNEMCVADGIIGHVYTWEYDGAPKNVGKRKCIYCGLDDMDI